MKSSDAGARYGDSILPEARELFTEFGVEDPRLDWAAAYISGMPGDLLPALEHQLTSPAKSLAELLRQSFMAFRSMPRDESRVLHSQLLPCLQNSRQVQSQPSVEKIRAMFDELGLKKVLSGSLTQREAIIVQLKLLSDWVCGAFPHIKCSPTDELDFVYITTANATSDDMREVVIRMIYDANAAGQETSDLLEILRGLNGDLDIGYAIATVRLASLPISLHIIDGGAVDIAVYQRAALDLFDEVAKRLGPERASDMDELVKVVDQEVDRITALVRRGGSSGGGGGESSD